MKIVAVSDTHNALLRSWGREPNYQIPDGDIFIHAGDLDVYDKSDWLEFCVWIKKLPHKYKVVIPGNHDFYIERYIKHILDGSFNLLIHESREIDGLKIFGSPYVSWCGNWVFQYGKNDAHNVWAYIPNDTDILITHSAPRGILDKTSPQYAGILAGCPALKSRVLEIKPKLHVFGHIHNGAGIKKVIGTTFINASVVDDDYLPNSKVFVVDI
jgi:Icc-related predicted phosphoesterase